jgi:hypothetical protein
MNSYNIFIMKLTRRQLQPEPGGRSAVNDDSRNAVASDSYVKNMHIVTGE